MSLSPNTTLGHYTIISKIGAGGMGEVYRARDTRLDREVAIKVLIAEVSRKDARTSQRTVATSPWSMPVWMTKTRLSRGWIRHLQSTVSFLLS